MRICVLNASYGDPRSEFLDLDPPPDPAPYLPDHTVDTVVLARATAVAQIRELAARGYDAFINLCDGADDEDRAGVEVPLELERLGLAFTGAGSAFYEPTRAAMKDACARAGIDTPRFAFAADREDAARAAATLRFPLIVKHPSSYGSIGLTPASRVETPGDLLPRVDEMARAHGAALIEEFIEGREITVLVAEPGDGEPDPRAYAPLEIVFPPGETFKHFHLKWINYSGMQLAPVTDPDLAARAMDASRRFFTAIGGSGYARCDMRVSPDGRLYMLEINPNCGIFYPPGELGSADFVLARDPAGHRGFLLHLLACAERRRRRAQPEAPERAALALH